MRCSPARVAPATPPSRTERPTDVPAAASSQGAGTSVLRAPTDPARARSALALGRGLPSIVTIILATHERGETADLEGCHAQSEEQQRPDRECDRRIVRGGSRAGRDSSEAKGPPWLAIQRKDLVENETYWMSGTKVFASVEPHPAPGGQYSSLHHPFQSFQWADYSAKPGYRYSYSIVAMYGDPAALQPGASVSVTVTTEPIEGQLHTVHFNRGSVATQEYARRFQNRPPSELGPAAYEWLSRGLLEGIVGFIRRAKGASFGLKEPSTSFGGRRCSMSFTPRTRGRRQDRLRRHRERVRPRELNRGPSLPPRSSH